MDASASPIQNSSSGATSLAGYLYQLDVSVWAALDLVLAKKLASQIVLEPVGEEDLEADLTDDDPGSIASGVDLPSYRLVIQAKLRNTGPWAAAEIVALLKHGKERMPAAERLRDEEGPLSARDKRRSPERRPGAPHCQSRRMAQGRGIACHDRFCAAGDRSRQDRHPVKYRSRKNRWTAAGAL